jgi:hypothetical protein
MATAIELAAYLVELKAARSAILLAKSYTVGNRVMTKADEKWVSAEIAETEYRLSIRTRGNRVEPRFLNNRG